MKIHKVVNFGNVPMGTKLFLTHKQASDRQHGLTVIKAATDTARGVYTANQQLGFKAGEELGLDGDLDRGMQTMLGLAEPAKPTKKMTARQQHLVDTKTALQAARDADAAAQQAVGAADEAGKAKATKDAEKAAGAVKRAESAYVKAGGKLDG